MTCRLHGSFLPVGKCTPIRLHWKLRFATKPVMTTGSGSNAAAGVEHAPAAWRELRADEDIQFEPVEIPETAPEPPGWLQKFLEWLGELFEPLGKALVYSWPILKWVLLAMAIAALLYLVIKMINPDWFKKREKEQAEEEVLEWQPEQHLSQALLEEADRLAAEGRFDEATHLLLERSVGHIADARPDWVEPSTTARELASLSALPSAARGAFSVIAERVERSLFALRSLERKDWEAARTAYAEFALARLDGAAV